MKGCSGGGDWYKCASCPSLSSSKCPIESGDSIEKIAQGLRQGEADNK